MPVVSIKFKLEEPAVDENPLEFPAESYPPLIIKPVAGFTSNRRLRVHRNILTFSPTFTSSSLLLLLVYYHFL